ncbi:hypothetical protein ACQ0QQ_17175 [Lysinibacillus sphaericus]
MAYWIGHFEVLMNEVSREVEIFQDGILLDSISLNVLEKKPVMAFRFIKKAVLHKAFIPSIREGIRGYRAEGWRRKQRTVRICGRQEEYSGP